MQSSPEDALALLKNWAEKNRFLCVTLEIGKVIVSANAKISFSEDGRILQALNFENQPEHHFSLQLPLADVERYEYFTPRDFTPTDPEYRVPDDEDEQAGLMLVAKNAVSITIFD